MTLYHVCVEIWVIILRQLFFNTKGQIKILRHLNVWFYSFVGGYNLGEEWVLTQQIKTTSIKKTAEFLCLDDHFMQLNLFQKLWKSSYKRPLDFVCLFDRVIGLQYGSKGNIVFGSRRRQPITLLDTWSATWTIKISAKLKQQIKTRRLYMTRQMGEY